MEMGFKGASTMKTDLPGEIQAATPGRATPLLKYGPRWKLSFKGVRDLHGLLERKNQLCDQLCGVCYIQLPWEKLTP
jgi:hypothetical protein